MEISTPCTVLLRRSKVCTPLRGKRRLRRQRYRFFTVQKMKVEAHVGGTQRTPDPTACTVNRREDGKTCKPLGEKEFGMLKLVRRKNNSPRLHPGQIRRTCKTAPFYVTLSTVCCIGAPGPAVCSSLPRFTVSRFRSSLSRCPVRRTLQRTPGPFLFGNFS